jgi:hypothetical protein
MCSAASGVISSLFGEGMGVEESGIVSLLNGVHAELLQFNHNLFTILHPIDPKVFAQV